MLNHTKIKQQCGICENKIWELNEQTQKLKKTDEYNEVKVRLNNASQMTVGVCNKHIKPKGIELDIMSEKVHQGWLEEVAFGIGNKEWVDAVGTKLKVVGV